MVRGRETCIAHHHRIQMKGINFSVVNMCKYINQQSPLAPGFVFVFVFAFHFNELEQLATNYALNGIHLYVCLLSDAIKL